VGSSRKELFSDKAIRTLIPHVKGIPRTTNLVCDNALTIAYAMDAKRVTAEMIESVLVDLRLRPAARRLASPARGAERQASSAHPRGILPRGRALLSSPRAWWGALGVAAGTALTLGAVAVVPGLPDRILRGARQMSESSLVAPPTERPSPPPMTHAEASVEPLLGKAPATRMPSAPEEASKATPALQDVMEQTTEAATTPVIEPPQPPTDEGGLKGGGAMNIPGRRLTVSAGATISEIVFDHYGRYSSLALDLVHEVNPEIRDLDLVEAGQPLWLPPLNLKTLLRRQHDGSYRLIVTSQPTLPAATTLANTVRAHGYAVVILNRKVASDNVLYRVEIHELKSRAAALRAWETSRRLDWLQPRAAATSVNVPPPRTRLSLSR
jgi:hypothetical protein